MEIRASQWRTKPAIANGLSHIIAWVACRRYAFSLLHYQVEALSLPGSKLTSSGMQLCVIVSSSLMIGQRRERASRAATW